MQPELTRKGRRAERQSTCSGRGFRAEPTQGALTVPSGGRPLLAHEGLRLSPRDWEPGRRRAVESLGML